MKIHQTSVYLRKKLGNNTMIRNDSKEVKLRFDFVKRNKLKLWKRLVGQLRQKCYFHSIQLCLVTIHFPPLLISLIIIEIIVLFFSVCDAFCINDNFQFWIEGVGLPAVSFAGIDLVRISRNGKVSPRICKRRGPLLIL